MHFINTDHREFEKYEEKKGKKFKVGGGHYI